MFLRSLCCSGLAVCAVSLGGCATYRPAPFDLAAYQAAWNDRVGADDVSVRAFAQRLATSGSPTTAPAFDPADGLSVDEAEALSLFYNPALRVARSKLAVIQARSETAGLWADPVIGVDAERIISGVEEPWVVAGTANLTLPISGRLDAERQRARAEHEVELLRVAEQEWTTRHKVRERWVHWSAEAQRIELQREVVDRLSVLAGVAKRLQESGGLSRAESRVFQIEHATRQAELMQTTAKVEAARLELHEMLGLMPAATVRLLPTVAGTVTSSAAATDHESLAIQIVKAEYEVAERALQREIRGQYPDLNIGPGFGTDEGDERVLLGLSLTLPIWNRNQQGVAEAKAGRELARTQLEAAIEARRSAIAVATIELDAASSQRELLERTVAPAADEQAEETRRLAELGEFNVLLLMDAVIRQHDAKSRLLDARVNEARAQLRIHLLTSPEQASTTRQQVQK